MNVARHRPVLVVFEGLDGTGKSTVAGEVAKALDAALLSTPPRWMAHVRPVLDEAFPRETEEATLFYAATVLAASREARGYLRRGRSVVMDRYWLSTRVYGGVLGRDLRLAEAERLLEPADMTVLLQADTDTRRKRLAKRRGNGAHDALTLQPEVACALEESFVAMRDNPVVGELVPLETAGRSPRHLAHDILRRIGR